MPLSQPSTIEQVLDFGIPALLVLIAVGFVYQKFLSPWVIPMLRKMWDALSGVNQNDPNKGIKEINYD